ncbi:MAG: TonB-dependent receptor [Novosphingobium sp.]
MGLAAPAQAQNANAPQAATDTGDIIVTARRSEEKLQDVPISITVLSQDAISKRNITNAGDLGAYVPSLATNANFGPEKSSFSIRGFIQEGRTSPSVGVYFADVVSPRANTGTTSGNGAGVGAFFDLQNVQVLKGPQGTLFGRNTTGGAILLVPTKPTDKLEGYIEGTLGNYNERRLQGVLNVPLGNSIRVRGAVDWNKADGYLHNISGVGPKDFGNVNYVSARLSVVADLTPDLENYTIFRYSKSNTHGNLAKIVSAGPYPGFPVFPGGLGPLFAPLAAAQIARGAGRDFWSVENSNPNPYERQETWQVINTTTWKASDTLTVKNIISYAQFKENTSFDLYGSNLLHPANYLFPGEPAGRYPTIVIEDGFTGDYAHQSTFTEEFQLQGRSANGKLDWQAGAYLEVSNPLDFNSAYNHIFLLCSSAATFQCTDPLFFGNISSANIKNFFNNKGIYAQATYDLSDKFSITAGIRYTMDRMKDESRNIKILVPTPGTAQFLCQNPLLFPGKVASNGNGPECNSIIKIKSNKPTWLIDLDYKPNSDMLLYAKWARGYRQGSIISGNVGLEVHQPETVDTYEVGTKATFRGAVPGYFNIAAFYNDFRNQQIAANAVISPAGRAAGIPDSQVIINVGKSRIWGVEVDASIRPFEGFKLDASYAYLNTKVLEITVPAPTIFFSALATVATKGGPLSQSPKNRVSVTATYTLPLDQSIGKLSLGATFTHTDANAVHKTDFDPVFATVKAIDLLNANVDWESAFGSPVDLSFFVTNLTNQKRVVYPIATYQPYGFETGYLNQPRMWGFRLKYRFGD